jgi:hypothetical protein
LTTTDDPSQRLALLPKFRSPPTPPPSSTPPPATGSPSTSPAPAGGSGIGSGVLYEPAPTNRTFASGETTPTAISSVSDSVKKPSAEETTKLLAGLIGLAAVGVGVLVSWRLRRKLRVPTKTEARDIAAPLARIALRHFDPSWLNADLADGIAAATATGAYLGDGPLLLGADLDAGIPDNLQEDHE